MDTRQRLHTLIDELSEHDLKAAEKLLGRLQSISEDPVRYALESAPEEQERITLEEEAAVREADDAIARGEIVSDDEIRRTLGL